MNKPFKLIIDNTLEFMFLFSNADAFYISARYDLLHGWVVPGCSNAHQAIELYIKAILKLNHEKEKGHNLIALLQKYEKRDTYFKLILENPDIFELLQELSKAYLIFRYGEAGAESNSREIIQLIDELVFHLRRIYLRNIESPSTKIFMSKYAKVDFLRDNKYFSEQDLTNNPIAQIGLPIGDDLPENFFNTALSKKGEVGI